jgi:hypothetical protein
MTEPITRLLRLTEAKLMTKAAQCTGGATTQLEDRAAQCNAWLFAIERNAGRVSPEREDEMRAACAEWLRMAR